MNIPVKKRILSLITATTIISGMTCAYNNVNAANAGEIDIADICKDNKINVFDLCVLKQILSK